ncbi:MAG: TIGR02281 family clan AA aspartic protease [Agarilytica sp.]
MSRSKLVAILAWSLMLMSVSVCAANDIVVRGLLKNMVVLEVNGAQRMIKAGKTSPEGITLISSNTKEAVVEIDGKRQTLTLSRQIGGVQYSAPEKEQIRIARGVGGHYFTPGRINGQKVNFLVDTGATNVAMSSLVANKLRLDYKSGMPVSISTANGVIRGYRIVLQSVSVGTVKIHNVEATVTEGAFPSEILLGNSYLARVEMNVDDGVLVLQAKF